MREPTTPRSTSTADDMANLKAYRTSAQAMAQMLNAQSQHSRNVKAAQAQAGMMYNVGCYPPQPQAVCRNPSAQPFIPYKPSVPGSSARPLAGPQKQQPPGLHRRAAKCDPIVHPRPAPHLHKATTPVRPAGRRPLPQPAVPNPTNMPTQTHVTERPVPQRAADNCPPHPPAPPQPGHLNATQVLDAPKPSIGSPPGLGRSAQHKPSDIIAHGRRPYQLIDWSFQPGKQTDPQGPWHLPAHSGHQPGEPPIPDYFADLNAAEETAVRCAEAVLSDDPDDATTGYRMSVEAPAEWIKGRSKDSSNISISDSLGFNFHAGHVVPSPELLQFCERSLESPGVRPEVVQAKNQLLDPYIPRVRRAWLLWRARSASCHAQSIPHCS